MERGLELAVLLYQIYFLLQGHNYTFMEGRHGIVWKIVFCRKKHFVQLGIQKKKGCWIRSNIWYGTTFINMLRLIQTYSEVRDYQRTRYAFFSFDNFWMWWRKFFGVFDPKSDEPFEALRKYLHDACVVGKVHVF